MVRDITLSKFVESKWFKLLARGAAIVGVAVAGYAGTILFDAGHRLDVIERDRELHIQENNARDAATGAAIRAIAEDIITLQIDATQIKVDVGTIKGMLAEIRREAVAGVPLHGRAQVVATGQ